VEDEVVIPAEAVIQSSSTNFRNNPHGFSDITALVGHRPVSLEDSISLIANRLVMPLKDYCELELFLHLNKNYWHLLGSERTSEALSQPSKECFKHEN